ncbi:MAG TPA: Uma2 family endonuclease [Anaerolineae bacterium]|nr:Uma2 family endonuclease [Anaerolineae bacterium]
MSENRMGTVIQTAPQARPRPPEQGQWTYEDWLRLPDDGFRYEVLNGVLYMTPPPRIRHQFTPENLSRRLGDFVTERKLGLTLFAPCGIRLPGQPVPVQTDILFVRAERRDIISEEYVEGAPDLVVEVLSPSNWLYDRTEKFRAYQEAGVPEYWIVDYRARTIEVFVLGEGTYALLGKFSPGEVARSKVLAGFEVVVEEVV